MSLVQSLRNRAILVEKNVSLAATSGTTVGISVPAGSLVLAAGFENTTVVPDITTYTMDITDGVTVFADDLNFDNAAAGSIKAGSTVGVVTTADTIDVVTTISGAAGVIAGRVWAVIIDCNGTGSTASEVDRDQLA